MRILIVLVCFGLSGCASVPFLNNWSKERIELKQTLSVKEQEMIKKDAEINRLQVLLMEKEAQLKEKDQKIEELKAKLKTFGVF
jgi:starvation-inducible outer membrane lipoprotein